MKLYQFPAIYRAVAFSIGGKPYLLRPANNTVVGPQMTPYTFAVQKTLLAAQEKLDLAKLQNQSKSLFNLFS